MLTTLVDLSRGLVKAALNHQEPCVRDRTSQYFHFIRRGYDVLRIVFISHRFSYSARARQSHEPIHPALSCVVAVVLRARARGLAL